MRRKLFATAGALVGVLLIAAVAYAAGQVNTYSVEGSTSPTKSGTKKKPVPVSISFGYKVGEQNGQRPLPVKKYSIRFAGLHVNTNAFPKCPASSTEGGKGTSGCPKGSIMGSGYIENQTGATADPNARTIHCNAKLTVVNSGAGKGFIYVEGSQTATNPREKCDIDLAAPIPAEFVKYGKDSAMEFTVPSTLLHPIAALDNAVVAVESTIRKATVRKGGRKVGFFESTGGCVKGRRKITVSFTTEDGVTKKASYKARCKK